MSRQTIAERTAEIIQREDAVGRWLGMKLLEIRAGYARLSMRVTENMVNGQAVCHGGMMFLLADTAFGYACNTHNERALAASCSIDFLAPAQMGDELTAEAKEAAHAGRTRLYDVRITKRDGTLVALFRGRSATVRGSWVE